MFLKTKQILQERGKMETSCSDSDVSGRLIFAFSFLILIWTSNIASSVLLTHKLQAHLTCPPWLFLSIPTLFNSKERCLSLADINHRFWMHNQLLRCYCSLEIAGRRKRLTVSHWLLEMALGGNDIRIQLPGNLQSAGYFRVSHREWAFVSGHVSTLEIGKQSHHK